MSSEVIKIANYQQYKKFTSRYRRIIIFYGASWCDACKTIKPLYTRIASKYCKRIKCAYVDIDANPELDFSAVPVFVGLRKGKQINSFEGSSEEKLKRLVREVIRAE